MLEFDEKEHRYTWHGKPVPSVTQCLNVLGGYEGIPRHILAVAASRGTKVHKATEFYDLGVLDWSTVSDEIFPYLEAYMNFLDDKKPEIIEIEKRSYHEKLGFAGTMDRIYILDGVKCIVDLKSSVKLMPAVGPQLAAYLELENQHEKKKSEQIKKRFGLKLKADGSYELQEYKDLQDLNAFLSCLNVVKWKVKNSKNFDFTQSITG